MWVRSLNVEAVLGIVFAAARRRSRTSLKGDEMSWFKVTNTSGASVYLNTENCLRVRANAGDHGSHANSVVDLIRGEQATMESPEEVSEAMSRADGLAETTKSIPRRSLLPAPIDGPG
jgi:hypothetical protein